MVNLSKQIRVPFHLIFIDIILGVNFHVNEQAELYNLARERIGIQQEKLFFGFKKPKFSSSSC